jgi:putative endonuclease
VHVEFYDTMLEAIQRGKQLKKWNRAWKVALIEANNPEWVDLWDTLLS